MKKIICIVICLITFVMGCLLFINYQNIHSMSLNNLKYKGFSLDNVIHSEYGDIHYNAYIPKAYDQKNHMLYI